MLKLIISTNASNFLKTMIPDKNKMMNQVLSVCMFILCLNVALGSGARPKSIYSVKVSGTVAANDYDEFEGYCVVGDFPMAATGFSVTGNPLVKFIQQTPTGSSLNCLFTNDDTVNEDVDCTIWCVEF